MTVQQEIALLVSLDMDILLDLVLNVPQERILLVEKVLVNHVQQVTIQRKELAVALNVRLEHILHLI